MATGLEIENTQRMRKQELMFAILKKRAKGGETIFGDGVLEVLPDGFGFLRSPEASYMASTDDIYISPAQIRRFNLHTGDAVEGEVRTKIYDYYFNKHFRDFESTYELDGSLPIQTWKRKI